MVLLGKVQEEYVKLRKRPAEAQVDSVLRQGRERQNLRASSFSEAFFFTDGYSSF